MPFSDQNKGLLLLLMLSVGYLNQAPRQESVEESTEETYIPFLESRNINSFIMTHSEERLEKYWKMTDSETNRNTETETNRNTETETNRNTETETNRNTETETEIIQEIKKIRNLNSVLLILRQQQRLKRR